MFVGSGLQTHQAFVGLPAWQDLNERPAGTDTLRLYEIQLLHEKRMLTRILVRHKHKQPKQFSQKLCCRCPLVGQGVRSSNLQQAGFRSGPLRGPPVPEALLKPC